MFVACPLFLEFDINQQCKYTLVSWCYWLCFQLMSSYLFSKHDYDLCGKCFQTHGVEGEYNKLERPVIKPHQVPMWVYGNGSRFHPMVPLNFSCSCCPYQGKEK